MASDINPRNYYRLPWSFSDNAVSWLEVTTQCNLRCEGCYRDPNKDGHKTLTEIADDLAAFKKYRKSDCISIAGGDPLVHPEIVEVVRMIKKEGWKPILNTNGLALTREFLRDLKKAGAFGFTFHIDTSQKRHDSVETTEVGHIKLRHKFAEMLAEEGGIACSFNQTVTSETIHEIPEIVRWARQHPDIVHTVVFILYRSPNLVGEFDYYANGQKLPKIPYDDFEWGGDRLLKTPEIIEKIREVEPDFEPSGYLNGTVDPDSMKWLIGTRAATMDRTIGYITPTFMEKAQNTYHLLKGRWLSYTSPRFNKIARSSILLTSPFDKGMRKMAKHYFRHPGDLLKKAYFQTFTIIQPVDLLADGRQSMCDGCPDITAHKGKLYWSCRLEEIKEHGCFMQAVPRRLSKKTEDEIELPVTPARPEPRPTLHV